tara:strand:+ start:1908 stop:2174 length:267 start_codon:yes stop_codon:yes gene_type:complete
MLFKTKMKYFSFALILNASFIPTLFCHSLILAKDCKLCSGSATFLVEESLQPVSKSAVTKAMYFTFVLFIIGNIPLLINVISTQELKV